MKKIFNRRIVTAVLTLVIIVAVTVGLPVWADSLVQTDQDVSSLLADRTVDGAAFLAGETVDVKGLVKGDLYCAGNNLTISGVVEGDVICAGNNMMLSGKVGGNVRIAGNNLTLGGEVEGSVTMAGNNIIVESSAKIGSDVLAVGNVVNVSGTVARDTRVMANSVSVYGVLGRNLDAGVDRLNVANTAKVGGHVYYTSSRDATIAGGSVSGEVRKTAPNSSDDSFGSKPKSSSQQALGALFSVVMLVATSVFLVLVTPRYVRSISSSGDSRRLLNAGLVGLCVLLLTPFIIAFLVISTIGLGAAVVLFVAYILSLLLATSITSYVVGRLLIPNSKNMFLTVLSGSLLVGIACVIPVFGFIALVVALCVGLGLVVLGLRSQYTGQAYSEEVVQSKVVNKLKSTGDKKR